MATRPMTSGAIAPLSNGKAGRIKGKGSAVQHKKIKMIRAERMVELSSKGVPTADIAVAHNLRPKSVESILRRSQHDGTIDRVRDRMRAQLDKIPNIYEEILNMDPTNTTVTKMTMAIHDLRLKAAKQLADGLGPFRKESQTLNVSATVPDLESFYKLRAARAAGTLPPSDLHPETAGDVIDAEVIPQAPSVEEDL